MTTNVNLYVDQGIDYSINVDAFDINNAEIVISDQTFTCRAKKIYASTVAFSIDIIVDLGDGDPNNLILNIPSASTLSINPGKYRYDLIMDDSVIKTKLMEGLLTIIPTVSL
jgi:hypothetical protein